MLLAVKLVILLHTYLQAVRIVFHGIGVVIINLLDEMSYILTILFHMLHFLILQIYAIIVQHTVGLPVLGFLLMVVRALQLLHLH